MSKPFTSLDGTDENGVRAEVAVHTGKGTVKEIKENTSKNVADVFFEVENLKFPIHGWIGMDETAYQLAKTAKDANEEITFRIEKQRKKNIDRATPIEELSSSMSVAKENINVLLVGVNGVKTSEAVTSPSEDPTQTGGRYAAPDVDPSQKAAAGSAISSISTESVLATLKAAAAVPEARQSILDALAAQALLHGATVEEVNAALVGNDKREAGTKVETPRASFSQEAPAWKEYNSDGRANLGATTIAAGVGIETLVYKQLDGIGLAGEWNTGEAVEYFSNLIFTISDHVQRKAYGEGSRADRAAQSHTRIRGLLYEVIDKKFPLPATKEDNGIRITQNDVNEWIKNVGGETVTRFQRAIRVSQQSLAFNQLTLPESLSGQPAHVSQPTQKAPAAAPQAAPEPVTVPETPAALETTPEPVDGPKVVTENVSKADKFAALKKVVETEPEKLIAENATQRLDDVENEADAKYPEGVMPPKENYVPEGELATPDTVSELKAMMKESGFDSAAREELLRFSKLLAWTYGPEYSDPKKLDNETLTDFIDWYVANGTEAINAALEFALKES
jgi:hypothetical protein